MIDDDDDDLRHEIDDNDDDSDMIKIMIWLKMPMMIGWRNWKQIILYCSIKVNAGHNQIDITYYW